MREEGPQTIMGFDVGSRRIGVAVGNTLSATARRVAVVRCDNQMPDWEHITRLVAEWQPARLVVGDPLSLEGEIQSMTKVARSFAEAVAARYDLPVDRVDERSTSQEAGRRFAGERRSGAARRKDAALLDALAAEIIVERWLRENTVSANQ